MVRIKDEWLLAVGSVALVGSLLFTDLGRLYVVLAALAIVALDVAFVMTRGE